MEGVFFGYKTETPCPKCGTPRVGMDFDDDYYIVPGYMKEVKCDFRVEDEYGAPWRKDLDFCPKCGKPTPIKTISGRFGMDRIYQCINYGGREVLVELEGCPHCRASGHNPYA